MPSETKPSTDQVLTNTFVGFGFTAAKTADLSLPGPFERERLLGLELRDGALDGAFGMIAATGTPARQARVHRPRTQRLMPRAA